ncbi:PssD/Cps14F family polysaccharide biosynthesis glycosyltransferase [Enterococcus sp. ZJ1668]|uniref:PssD/Cps14F family polysaccharide biosynthesis glycosyltransferase n=1 Tax=Enterococcus sp. ZJ1668 TaxID=2709402 RepID=UPI001F149A61|nr:PssD/Cps14F family polysaccharide biosynthesis glycosyltransferase [Enterococcus sp. ZJ1668]
MKICLIASSGGHYEQLLMLDKLARTFDVFFVTEKTTYSKPAGQTYYLKQVNRKEPLAGFYLLSIICQTLYIFFKEKPDAIISTGVLSAIPMMMLGKLWGKKIIYIESFAKIASPTKTGKLIYKFSDIFIIQWEGLKVFYPDAIYLGSIY